MTLDDQFAATIQKVRAGFGFDSFNCSPDEITSRLQIEPDEVRIRGTILTIAPKHTFEVPFNSWGIGSSTLSKDVNDHLRELLDRLKGKADVFDPGWGIPSFGITYRASHLFSGNGPFYEVDVLQGIASLGAELWQDIYALDENPNEPASS